MKEFNKFLGSLPHKHKIVIAGNHELSFDQKFRKKSPNFEGPGKDDVGDGDRVPATTFNANLLASPRSSHAGGDFFSAGMTLGSTSSKGQGGSIPTLGMDRLTLSEAVEVR